MVITLYLDFNIEIFIEPRHSIFMVEYDELYDEARRGSGHGLTARIVHLLMAHLGEGRMVK